MAGQWGLKRTGSPPMLKLEESSSHPRALYGLGDIILAKPFWIG